MMEDNILSTEEIRYHSDISRLCNYYTLDYNSYGFIDQVFFSNNLFLTFLMLIRYKKNYFLKILKVSERRMGQDT